MPASAFSVSAAICDKASSRRNSREANATKKTERFRAKWDPVRVKKTRQKDGASNHITRRTFDVLKSSLGSALF
jgi:hypothetical protein